jgi:UPF0755 protein
VKVVIKFFGYVFMLFLIVLAGVGLLAYQFINTSATGSEQTVVFEVAPGESFKTIARHLEQAGLVQSAMKLQIYARLTGQAAKTRVGEYAIRGDSKPLEVLNILASGHSIEHGITISEGLNIFEIADIVAKAKVATRTQFLGLVHDPKLIAEMTGENMVGSLEGYLFPETYAVTKFTAPRALVKMMVDRFNENYNKVSKLPNWNPNHLTKYQLVTLASIVEKETGAPEERPVIASVFYNRLRTGMRLQTDPTVIYGIWEQSGHWNRNISRDDLNRPSRYNTYTLSGLPAGPVANPGIEALKAAGNPAQSEFFFFVSRNDGTHIFSKSYEQHQQATTQFQLDRKAREGKSWRDLKNRTEVPATVNAAPEMKPKVAPKVKADSKPGNKTGNQRTPPN